MLIVMELIMHWLVLVFCSEIYFQYNNNELFFHAAYCCTMFVYIFWVMCYNCSKAGSCC